MAPTGDKHALPKKRLLPRLWSRLTLHVYIVSFGCYLAGVVAVLLLPLLANNTHISENALMPGSGSPSFGRSDTWDARALATEVKDIFFREHNGRRAVARWLVKQMAVLGADCYVHPFVPQQSAFSSDIPHLSPHLQQSTSNASSGSSLEMQSISAALNVAGIIRAPQGDGNEAIVLVTPFDAERFGPEAALSLGIGLAVFTRLSTALWTARDVIWLVADAKYGLYSAVAEWLREYHEPTVGDLFQDPKGRSKLMKEFTPGEHFSGELESVENLSEFKRAGTITSGLIFEVAASEPGDVLTLRAEGPNGQMPNLDFVNIINSIAVWRESLSLRLETIPSLRDSVTLKYIGKALQKVASFARQINPGWDFTYAAASYPKTMGTLLSSMFLQVIGLPTGAHGAFRDYQIDAVSLRFPAAPTVFDHSITRYGRLLEAVVRCVNNLLEKWHHSFFLYFLSGPNKYISVGVYMQPFALLLFTLPLTAAALFFRGNKGEIRGKDSQDSAPLTAENTKDKHSSTKELNNLDAERRSRADGDSEPWLQALCLVTSIQIWALFVAVTFALISRTMLAPDVKFSLWLATAAVSLKVSFGAQSLIAFSTREVTSPARNRQTKFWVAVKALTMGPTSIALAVMSTINYPIALAGALVLVPMCLGAFPLRFGWIYARHSGRDLRATVPFVVGAMIIVLGFLLGIICLAKFSWGLTPTKFWSMMETLLNYRSAFFHYLLVIQLPCLVLFLTILFSAEKLN